MGWNKYLQLSVSCLNLHSHMLLDWKDKKLYIIKNYNLKTQLIPKFSKQ